MDNYIIELFGGSTIEITFDEYGSIIGKTGLVLLKHSRQTVNTAAIKRIVPKKDYEIDDWMERREKQKTGILHDGTHVIKHFGQWYLLDGDYDSNGRPLSRVAPEWHPELDRDCMPIEQEFHLRYACLPKEECLKLIIGKFAAIQSQRGEEVIKQLE